MTSPQPSELVVAESGAITPSAKGASDALKTYLEIQRVFDDQMPECIMEIQGKKFRKKAYWRAIATAFRVEARLVSEERIELEDDWGYTATYRAITADGRKCDGDGACMASEKHGAMGTVHNVRAHAHTRAKNRAIADLVGFGEVSADELGPDSFEQIVDRAIDDEPPPPGPQNEEVRKDGKTRTKQTGGTLTKAQIKALGIWRAGFKASEAVHGQGDEHKWRSINWALDQMGYDRVDQVPASEGDELVRTINAYPEQRAAEEVPF